MRECLWCGRSIVMKNRQARFCSGRCRVAAHRNPLPKAMTEADRWVRYDSDKRPLTTSGTLASSTNPATWTSHNAAKKSPAGVGLGFALGDGFACIDLDHCLNAGQPNQEALTFLEAYPSHYIEISPSGDGLHVWGTAEAAIGRRQTINGLHVERYSTGRYITVTRNVYQHGSLLPL